MIAIYDRRAGVTHLLSEPAGLVLETLGADEAGFLELLLRLGVDGDAAQMLLAERLDELVATGLVMRR